MPVYLTCFWCSSAVAISMQPWRSPKRLLVFWSVGELTVEKARSASELQRVMCQPPAQGGNNERARTGLPAQGTWSGDRQVVAGLFHRWKTTSRAGTHKV